MLHWGEHTMMLLPWAPVLSTHSSHLLGRRGTKVFCRCFKQADIFIQLFAKKPPTPIHLILSRQVTMEAMPDWSSFSFIMNFTKKKRIFSTPLKKCGEISILPPKYRTALSDSAWLQITSFQIRIQRKGIWERSRFSQRDHLRCELAILWSRNLQKIH